MSNLETTWEPAPPEAWPTVAYLGYWSLLMMFNGRGQPTGIFQDYYMMLPYTEAMLARRQEREWEAVK